MRRPMKLRCELLETRTVPAFFGRAWADHNITLSFVPDGTKVDGVPSNLFAFFQAQGLGTTFQSQILRAATQWIKAGNLSIGVVPDGGQELSILGLPQHDPRFGDIRVSARSLAPDVIALTIPPGPLGGTRAGDIVINSDFYFGTDSKLGYVNYDLYSCMLQETAHALGLGNSLDPNSPRFEYYGGARYGLTPNDNADLVALYGPRTHDSLEGPIGNASPLTANVISTPTVFANGANRTIVANADLTTYKDTDVYRFRVPTNAGGPTLIRLKSSGISLIAPRLTVLAANGTTVLATTQAANWGTDLSVVIPTVPGVDYFVKIERGQLPDFVIGRYQLQLAFDPNNPNPPTAAVVAPIDDLHTDDLPLLATVATPDAGFPANSVYHYTARIRDLLDVDNIRIHAPTTPNNLPATLTVSVRALGSGDKILPALEVYNAMGQSVPTNVLVNARGEVTVQVPNALPNQDYILNVSSRADGPTRVGDYRIDADFTASRLNLNSSVAGGVSAAQPVSVTYATVTVSQIVSIVLTVNAGPLVPSTVDVIITDTSNRPLMDFYAKLGETNSALTFLRQGTYKITVRGQSDILNLLMPNLTYSLKIYSLSDPIGPQTGSTDRIGDYETDDVEIDDAYFSLNSFTESRDGF